jgi:peptidoglycan-N-acetylglucosamine deacetylase
MHFGNACLVLTLMVIMSANHTDSQPLEGRGPFLWPQGKQMALSLSFDDALPSQVDIGLPLLDEYDAKATFFLSFDELDSRLQGWRAAVANGHEMGNHTLSHPCTGNFVWSRQNPLEEYTLEQMRGEIEGANQRIESLLGVVPETFAYPCGQTFVGRSGQTASYVPLVAGLFVAGRGWMAEWNNDPQQSDLAQTGGREMDGKTFDQIRPILEDAQERGQWTVLGGHQIGDGGFQTTRIDMLRQLLQYAGDPANGIWLAPVGTVARYIAERR